ncbi:MAG: uroporphyrinogen decarboxylase family protein, partial [Candidatus Helarchaeota archaeon]|nr:uroporphyrinogen decarboxylase family protein [Candidatus Helarchaeota archaeon]
MAYKGVLDDIQKCIDLKEPDNIPMFADSEEFDVKIAGMVYEDYCQDTDKIFECQKLVIKRFGYDWCWLQIDDCIEFEILGVGCKGEGNLLRATYDYLPATSETIKNLKIPDFSKEGRFPVLLEAIKKSKDYFKDTVCVTGRTAAPFSSVNLLYGINETMMMIIENQDLLRETLEFFTELQIKSGLEQIKAGADAIWFGDCCASSNFISPDQYKEFAFPYAKKVAEKYQKNGAWTFYHASENNPVYIKIMSELNVSALSVGENINVGKAKEIVKGQTCLIGNLDPINVLFKKSPDEVARETEKILKAAAPGGGYIFNTSEMVPRDTPEENMFAMVNAVR